jgi:hypothetical protein
MRSYDGEPIPDLVYDPNKRVQETDALNILGARGYDVYDVERRMDGQQPVIIFRLKTNS